MPLNVPILPLKRVLCALDVERSARAPLAHASSLSQQLGLPLDGLYVAPPLGGWEDRLARVRRLISEHNARERLDALLAPFASLLDVQSFVTRGASGDVIGAHAAQHCADLIVIGSARQRTTAGATHLASRLSAAAERGVLTVPGDSPSCALRTILLPVTARTPETPALAWVTMLARSFGARVELVAVEPTSLGFWRSLTRRPPLSAALPDEVQHALRVVERSLSAAGITTSGVNAVRPALEVESWVESAECDLVVVGLPASVASQEAVLLERLRKNGTTPVLSIRASKRLAAVATHRRLDDECELSASA
jgi:hypothetical protein